MPMPVSSSRDRSMLGSSLAPVVSTTSAVAAAVVVSARSPRTEPAISPIRIGEPERQRVEAEDAPERERHQHAEHGRADLLDATAQRAVDGGVDGEQRRPRGEERLLDVEHVDREHPRDHRREDRLDDLQRVRPPDRIPEPSPHAEPS